MDQAVSRRLPTAEARVRSRVSPCGIGGGQSGIGAGFSPSTSVFPCHFHSTGAPLLGKGQKKRENICTVWRFLPSFCNFLYCTVLYCIVLTVLYCIVLTVLYCIVLYCTVLYCIVLYCIALYCTYCIVLTVLYCIVLYCTVLYCTPQQAILRYNPYSFLTGSVIKMIYVLFTCNRDEPNLRTLKHVRYKPVGRPFHIANCNSMPSKSYLLPGRANQKERTAD
jgi:hypothetical protein